jgi:uncharacterized membrane protein (UPF0127 family)
VARQAVRIALCTLALLASLAAGCGRPGAEGARAGGPDGFVTIGGQRIAVDLAVTPAEQQLGLGERDALPWDQGMLFLYEEPAFHRFWMKGMRFDIDIVWIRGDRIVDVSHRVPHVPGGNGPIVAPAELADKVLEVNAGYASAHGWRPGQRVQLDLRRKPAGEAPRS